MLFIQAKVGAGCPNRPEDVKAVHQKLMDIAKIPCYPCTGNIDDTIHKGIRSVQSHFLAAPDGVIDVNGTTHRYLNGWSEKPINSGVVWVGRLREAWDLVNPLLPNGSYCASAFRSADDQRRILHNFFRSLRIEIIGKHGQKKYDEMKAKLDAGVNLALYDDEVLEMVRGAGQAIAKPGRSKHQQGKAIDIGGPANLDNEQVRIVKMVARANPTLLTGYVLKERNSCVHFETH
jgi:hypothetical protein